MLILNEPKHLALHFDNEVKTVKGLTISFDFSQQSVLPRVQKITVFGA